MSGAVLRLAFGGLHPDRVRSLADTYGLEGTLRRVIDGRVKTSERARAAVATPAQERREQLDRTGIDFIVKGEAGYPRHLAELPDAPLVLFVRGSLPDTAGVAVVGTRRSTAYGRQIAREYGEAIARAGWPLVSGLARGIDGAAHKGTVSGGGIGVAVLGSGIDVMYPREHASLACELVDSGGAVISEAPPGTPPEAWRFPPRNRVISGLAAVVVVVEATVKGGALITAEAALRHGRQVFAVPGDIRRSSSAGCNLLIRDGAFPVHDAEDLVESLELILGPAVAPVAKSPTGALSPEEAAVLAAMEAGCATAEEILAMAGIDSGQALIAIGRLEISGVVRAEAGGRYVIGR